MILSVNIPVSSVAGLTGEFLYLFIYIYPDYSLPRDSVTTASLGENAIADARSFTDVLCRSLAEQRYTLNPEIQIFKRVDIEPGF